MEYEFIYKKKNPPKLKQQNRMSSRQRCDVKSFLKAEKERERDENFLEIRNTTQLIFMCVYLSKGMNES